MLASEVKKISLHKVKLHSHLLQCSPDPKLRISNKITNISTKYVLYLYIRYTAVKEEDRHIDNLGYYVSYCCRFDISPVQYFLYDDHK